MAKFYDYAYHEDEFPEKRKLTEEDIKFLINLQKEMNTQDHIGEADPRFWMIRETERIYNVDSDADGFEIYNESSCNSYSEDEFYDYLGDTILPELYPEEDGYTYTMFQNEDNDIELTIYLNGEPEESLDSTPDIIEHLNDNGYEFKICWYREISVLNGNGFFLTHKDAQEYLKHKAHHYSDDAHTYALTAFSPEIEKLYDILHKVDFESLLNKEDNEERPDDESPFSDEIISPTVKPVSAAEAKNLIYQEWKNKVKEPDSNPRLLVAYDIAMKDMEIVENQPCDGISRLEVNNIISKNFVDVQDGMSEWRNKWNDTLDSMLAQIDRLTYTSPRSENDACRMNHTPEDILFAENYYNLYNMATKENAELEKKLKTLTDEIYPAQLDVLDIPAYMPGSDSADEIREYMRQSNHFSDEIIARADESFCYGFGCARDLIFSMLKKKFWDVKKTHPVIAQPCEDKIRYVSKSELNNLCKDFKKYVDKLGIPSDELAMLHNYIDNIYDLYSQAEDIPHIQTREDAVSRDKVNDLITELARAISDERMKISRGRSSATIMRDILHLPPASSQIQPCENVVIEKAVLNETFKKIKEKIERLVPWDECLVEIGDVEEIIDKHKEELLQLCEDAVSTHTCDVVDRQDLIDSIDELASVIPQPCEDAVSRKAIIDSLKGIEALFNNDKLRTAILSTIRSLPSVQPCREVVSREAVSNYINNKLTAIEEMASAATNEGRWREEEKYLYGVEILEDIDEYIKDMPFIEPTSEELVEAYNLGYNIGIKEQSKAKAEVCEDAVSRRAGMSLPDPYKGE